MAEKLGEALLDLDTDDRKFNQGVDRAGRKATGLGRTFDDVGRRAALLGKAMASAAAIGAAAFTAGIAGAVRRLEDMRKMSAQVDQALKNSGNSARTSAAELQAWAEKLQDKTGRAAEEIMAVGANLASFGFGREQFYRAIQLADDMSAAWGGDLRQNLEGLSRALDDPISGMAMLSKRGVKLTADQKDLAKSFLDAGEKAKAQGVVFDALEAQVKGVAEAGFTGLSAAIARAQERWENAFEDLVQGNGDAADLRDTLVDLANTVSSPEFIAAMMGLGEAVVDGIRAAIPWLERFATNIAAIRDMLVDFNDMSKKGQENAIVDLQNQITTVENRITENRQRLSGGGIGTLFGLNNASLQAQIDQDIKTVQPLIDKLNELRNAHAGTGSLRAPGESVAPSTFNFRGLLDQTGGSFDPYAGQDTRTEDTRKAADKQHKAFEALIADLEHERDIVGLSTQDQEIMNTVRRAGVGVMSDEGLQIRAIMTVTDEHRDQLERMEDTYKALGDAGGTALKGLVDAMQDGKVEGTELLGILGNVLSMAGQFFLNQGSKGGAAAGGIGTFLGSLFSGFFADGGLIPSGSFGIVGEQGPEPVFATSRGAQVSSNSSLADVMGGAGRGDTYNVTINGTNLSEAELTSAIRNGIDRYDRFQLPGRVAAINADPLARG